MPLAKEMGPIAVRAEAEDKQPDRDKVSVIIRATNTVSLLVP